MRKAPQKIEPEAMMSSVPGTVSAAGRFAAAALMARAGWMLSKNWKMMKPVNSSGTNAPEECLSMTLIRPAKMIKYSKALARWPL